MDPETLEIRRSLDDGFEDVLLLDPPSGDQDDDIMPGEFDTL